MKHPGLGLICAAICVAHAGFALASTAAAGGPAVAHPGTFAARSAAFARRLAPEQREEWRLLKDAAAAGHFENEAARMALARSGNPNVRSLAAALVNHHASAQATLRQMLHARNMATPMLSNEQRKSLNRLAKLQGAHFDREWTEAVGLDSQQNGVLLFERAANTVRDPAMRSWIARTLPTMRMQLAAAERMANGSTKLANLAPSVRPSTIKSPGLARRYTGAAPAALNPADLGEGNMLLGPARPVALKLTEPNTR
jgi:putative membrane protein